MRCAIIVRYVILISLVLALAGCDTSRIETEQARTDDHEYRSYSRIISLSPSITETLFALGLGERVVGVTRFCTYPPQASEKQSVGGYLDPSYETMVLLEPDLVLLLEEHESVRVYLDRLGIHHATVHNRTIDEIMGTITTIGEICCVVERADSLSADIGRRMDGIRGGIPPGPRPRVLVSVGRTMGSGTLTDVYAAGAGTFYDELIDLAGGENVYSGGSIAYPLLSAEGLLHLNPDIIFDLVPDFEKNGYDREAVLDEWHSVENVRAVKNSMVFLLTGDYTVIPGPRFILLLEDVAEIIHASVRIP